MSLVALNDAALFQRLSATRHRLQSSVFVLSFHPLDVLSETTRHSVDGSHSIFLGFVLPKKLVKRAVDRNQIKRWARTFLRTHNVPKPCAVVIKAKTKVFFAAEARSDVREDLAGLVDRWTHQMWDVKNLRLS